MAAVTTLGWCDVTLSPEQGEASQGNHFMNMRDWMIPGEERDRRTRWYIPPSPFSSGNQLPSREKNDDHTLQNIPHIERQHFVCTGGTLSGLALLDIYPEPKLHKGYLSNMANAFECYQNFWALNTSFLGKTSRIGDIMKRFFRSARILIPFGNHPTVLSLMLQFTCSCSGDGVLKGTEQSSYQTRWWCKADAPGLNPPTEAIHTGEETLSAELCPVC